MAWIEAHSDLPDHPKTVYCASLLHIDRDLLVGKLVRLWTWAIDYRDNGRFLSEEAPMIAEKMRWPRQGPKAIKQLMDALCAVAPREKAGFFVKSDSGYEIYNWRKYAGKLAERRRKDRERHAGGSSESDGNLGGNPQEFHGNSAGIPVDDSQNSDGYRNPNRNPNQDTESAARATARKDPETDASLSEIGQLYEDVAKGPIPAALSEDILFRLHEGTDPALIKEALRNSMGKQNIPAYFKAVMKSWTAQGIKTHADLMARVKTIRPTVKKTGTQDTGRPPSYDIDEFVRLSIARTTGEVQNGALDAGTIS